MKKLITILIFLLAGITLQAQQTKKVFIVVQSEDAYVSKTENGKKLWRDDIIYKKYFLYTIDCHPILDKALSETPG